MPENDAGTPTHRTTLLVGYGAFGLDVLRRLLASTAPRGVLNWREPQGGASASERQLRDLALLWVPDRWELEGQQVDADSVHEASSLEMMRDLYRQIRQVPEVSTPEADLAAAMLAAAETLLSAPERGTGPEGAMPLGLDVVVLARPTGPEVIGFLDRMVARGMDELANNANLMRAVQGSEVLNFIEVLDFDNYWDRSESGREIRRAVHNSVERWRKHREEHRPAFGRCYLVDGRTQDGMRSPRVRVEEISLFLEFLLFEGQRGGTFQFLYQSPRVRESPVATFGIRLMERSAGLLSRLAAARFGIGWLDYLAGGETVQSEAPPEELRQRLRSYLPAKLDELLHRKELDELLDRGMKSLEQQVTALPVEDPEWPQRVRACYEQRVQELEGLLTEKAGARMLEIGHKHLAKLPEKVGAGIHADLHNPRRPVPLGAVIAEVEGALKQLDVAEEIPAPPADTAPATLDELARLHRAFRSFNTQRVHVERLKQWWPLLALILTAGLTPIAVELMTDLIGLVPQPDATERWLTMGWNLLQYFKHPLVVTPLVFLAAWGLGTLAMHKRLAARVDRARRFYDDPDRGRFTDLLRAGLKPGGVLRAPSEHFLRRQLSTMALSVRSDVSRELGRIAARLHERKREMVWLRLQLRAFLRLHGLSVDGQQDELASLGQDDTRIRHSVAHREDFEQMLRSNPPSPERFRSTQATSNPFAQWDERYSDAFLYPLSFIDRLSGIYRDPFMEELARPGTGPEQESRAREFLSFLASHGSFDLAFFFTAQEGLPPDRRYCLLPAIWRRLPGVLPDLRDLGVVDEDVLLGADVARAYLLRIRTGVEPSCLVDKS